MRPPQTLQTAFRMLLSCMGLGAAPALINLVFEDTSLRSFGYSALYGFIYATCIAVPCWLVMPRAICRLHERSAGIRIAAAIAVLGVSGMGGCLRANLILVAMHFVRPADLAFTYWRSLKICLLLTFSFGILSMTIATLQERLASAKQELHLRLIAEERERKIAAEARFASLESRVRPHFLFNTLNSISALVREDPAEAERMIERLSALLRFSLDTELAGLVALREELTIVRDYLEIEKVRFGARLRYRVETSEAANALMVPALSIQTLVENSVKYAVGARREGAEIVVSAWVREGKLRVEVQDDGPGFEPASGLKPGHGLDLLQRRLASFFGSGACLEMSASNGRTLVAISVAS